MLGKPLHQAIAIATTLCSNLTRNTKASKFDKLGASSRIFQGRQTRKSRPV